SVMWWVLYVPLTIVLFSRGWTRAAGFVAVTVAGSTLLNTVLKLLIARPRPTVSHPVQGAHGYSFPSGHAQAAVVGVEVLLFLLVVYSVPRRRLFAATIGGAAIVVAIAFSRLALGVHYLSDVVGSVLVGTVWVLVTAYAFLLWPGWSRATPATPATGPVIPVPRTRSMPNQRLASG
ncbi:MAG: hypothetical protein JWM76_5162, partial [Pseudonocardiales bacterium]|nr:hypothetical protein [Pseudonocardiales bacterium]